MNLALYNKGSVLIVVMILGAIMALISLALLESSVLQTKMVGRAHYKLTLLKKLESHLMPVEKQLCEHFQPMPISSNVTITPLQFVPDTLQFQESQGAQYYQLTTKSDDRDQINLHISTTIAVRTSYPCGNSEATSYPVPFVEIPKLLLTLSHARNSAEERG